jgi:hypothetical protein
MSDQAEVLPARISKILISLFKYPNDSSNRDLTEIYRKVLPSLPRLTAFQLSKLEECSNKPFSSFGSILSEAGYKLPYEGVFVRELVTVAAENPPETPDCVCVGISFQTLSLLFVSKGSFCPESFDLFMQAITMKVKDIHSFLDLVLYFLLRKGFEIREFPWDVQRAHLIITNFLERDTLGPDYYPLLCKLLSRMQAGWKEERDFALSVVYVLYEQRRSITEVDNHKDVLDYIYKSLMKLDQNALGILACISSRFPMYDIEIFIIEISTVFINQLFEVWGELCFQEEKIHDLPDCVKDVNEMMAVGSEVTLLPARLSHPAIDLKTFIPDKTQLFLSKFEGFFANLDRSALARFVRNIDDILQIGPEAMVYQGIAAFALLLSKNVIPTAGDFLDGCFVGNVVFKPQCSVYGPMDVVPLVNALRGIIVEMLIDENPKMLMKLIVRVQNHRFLVAELFARILCDVPSVARIEWQDQVINVAFDTSAILTEFGPCSDARTPCFLFLSELLYGQSVPSRLLTGAHFITRYLNFLNEIHYRSITLRSFTKAFVEISDIELFPKMETGLTALIDATWKDHTLFFQVFRTLMDIVLNAPLFAAIFGKHLDFFLKRVDSESFETCLDFLKFVVAADPGITLSASRWTILTPFITVKHYPVLLNLVAATHTISDRETVIFRRPSFLPLLIFSIGADRKCTDSFLEYCLKLSEYSDVNARALHDGEVDSMLLIAITQQGKSRHYLTEFPFSFSDPLTALRLLYSIICTICDYPVATKFLRAIEVTGDPALIHTLELVVWHYVRDFRNQFPIGIIPTFPLEKMLNAEDLIDSFTVAFWLRIGKGWDIKSNVIFPIITFTDQNNASLTICQSDGWLRAILKSRESESVRSLFSTPNIWTHYVIQFEASKERSSMMIYVFRDSEYQEYIMACPSPFPSGDVEVCLSGSKGQKFDRSKREEWGRISQLFVFRGCLKTEDIFEIRCMGEIINRSALISPQDFENIEPETRLTCMTSETFLRGIIRVWGRLRNDDLLSVIANLADEIKEPNLVLEFGSLLHAQPRPFSLYAKVFAIAQNVRREDMRLIWFEDIMINFSLWDMNDNEFANYVRTIVLSEFLDCFSEKSYFCYFLSRINLLAPRGIELVHQIALAQFQKADGFFLLGWLTNHSHEPTLLTAGLQLAIKIASKLVQIHDTAFESILQFVCHKSPEIAMLAIQCIHSLTGQHFYRQINSVCAQITPNSALFSAIEKAIVDIPDLFSLSCAICHSNNDFIISRIPTTVTIAPLWFYFPMRLFIRESPERQIRFGHFIAVNATTSIDEVHKVFSMMWHLIPDSDISPMYALIQCFINPTIQAPADVIAAIFLHIMGCVFFRVSIVPIWSELFIDFQESPFALIPDDEKETESESTSECDHTSFFFYVELDGPNLKLSNLLTDAAKLLSKASDIPVPGPPDFSLSYTCEEIYRVVSCFPWSDPATIAIEKLKLFDDIVMFLRTAMNHFYSLMIRDLESAFCPIPPGEIASEYPSIGGRLTEVSYEPQETKLSRHQSIVGMCPFLVFRNKSQQHPPRLFTNGRFFPGQQFEGNARWITFSKTCTVQILLKSTLIVIQTKFERYSFKFRKLKKMICMNDTKVNLLFRHFIMALEFSPGELQRFLSEIESLKVHPSRPLVLTNPKMDQRTITAISRNWCKGAMTSFKFVVLLNWLSGRTFANPSSYPVFPPPVKVFGTLTDTSMPSLKGTYIEESGPSPEIDFSTKLFVLPEWYFFAEVCGSLQKVYENRKLLERRKDLHVWIWEVFGGSQFRHQQLFWQPIHRRKRFRPNNCKVTGLEYSVDSEIVFCTAVKSNHDETSFVCITANGTLLSFKVSFTIEETFLSVDENHMELEKVSVLRFWGWRDKNSIVAFDGSKLIVLTMNSAMQQIEFSFPDPIFSNGFVRSAPAVLSKIHLNSEMFVVKPFLNQREHFCCFARSKRFGITAIGCDDGKLRIRLNETTLKLTTVSLDGELPVKILITKQWGFVVVKTTNTIQVSTSTGLFVNKRSHSTPIKNWTCFESFDGFDFVGYGTESGKIWYFEAAKPELLKSIIVSEGKICAFTFNWRVSRFVVVMSDGTVQLSPPKSAQL